MIRRVLILVSATLGMASVTYASPSLVEHYERSLWLGSGATLDTGYLLLESTLSSGITRVSAGHYDGRKMISVKRLLNDDFEPIHQKLTLALKPFLKRQRPRICPRVLMMSFQEARQMKDQSFVCLSALNRNVQRQVASVIDDLK